MNSKWMADNLTIISCPNEQNSAKSQEARIRNHTSTESTLERTPPHCPLPSGNPLTSADNELLNHIHQTTEDNRRTSDGGLSEKSASSIPGAASGPMSWILQDFCCEHGVSLSY